MSWISRKPVSRYDFCVQANARETNVWYNTWNGRFLPTYASNSWLPVAGVR